MIKAQQMHQFNFFSSLVYTFVLFIFCLFVCSFAFLFISSFENYCYTIKWKTRRKLNVSAFRQVLCDLSWLKHKNLSYGPSLIFLLVCEKKTLLWSYALVKYIYLWWLLWWHPYWKLNIKFRLLCKNPLHFRRF